VLRFEIGRNPDPERRRRVEVLLGGATESVSLDERVERRGTELEVLGFGAFDALHLACASSMPRSMFSLPRTTDYFAGRGDTGKSSRFRWRIR
jgi:hypothetical protein